MKIRFLCWLRIRIYCCSKFTQCRSSKSQPSTHDLTVPNSQHSWDLLLRQTVWICYNSKSKSVDWYGSNDGSSHYSPYFSTTTTLDHSYYCCFIFKVSYIYFIIFCLCMLHLIVLMYNPFWKFCRLWFIQKLICTQFYFDFFRKILAYSGTVHPVLY